LHHSFPDGDSAFSGISPVRDPRNLIKSAGALSVSNSGNRCKLHHHDNAEARCFESNAVPENGEARTTWAPGTELASNCFGVDSGGAQRPGVHEVTGRKAELRILRYGASRKPRNV
jgi:hypothetical protein